MLPTVFEECEIRLYLKKKVNTELKEELRRLLSLLYVYKYSKNVYLKRDCFVQMYTCLLNLRLNTCTGQFMGTYDILV